VSAFKVLLPMNAAPPCRQPVTMQYMYTALHLHVSYACLNSVMLGAFVASPQLNSTLIMK